MHLHYIEDETGDAVDVVNLCSDACNRDYCEQHGLTYDGWNGCNELEFTGYCANCGVVLPGEDACECQLANVVVNRFLSVEGETCEHGNWVQLPGRLVPAIRERLEQLRSELRAERISLGELIELQNLAPYIEAGDVELAEAAGINEQEFAKR